MRKKAFAILFGFLILGVTLSSASATASFVNGTVTTTVAVPPELTPEKKPGDEVQPQAIPGILLVIGAILVDNALSLAIEHYVSPEAAMAYDALSTILAPDPTDIVRGGKWGIKILAKDGDEITRFSMGIVREHFGHKVMVRKFTEVSSENARWVVRELGKEYLDEIGKKYVKKRGMDFDETVRTLKRIRKWLTNKNSFKEVVRRDWDIARLCEIFDDVEGITGWKELRNKINRGLKQRYVDLGPLYEAEVTSHLRRSGWTIEEVEHSFKLHGKTGDVDIVAWKNGERVYIECKRRSSKISTEQLLKEAEYANMNGVRELVVYYSRDTASMGQWYRIREAVRESRARCGVEIKIEYYGSEFN